MRKTKTFGIIVVFSLTLLVLLMALKGCSKQTTTLQFETNKINLEIGQTVQLTPTFPKDCSNVQWISRNESVATVDNNGNVTALAIGSAIIKLTVTVNEQTQSALCQVTVVEKGAEAVGQMIVSDSKVTIFAGETYTTTGYLQFGNSRLTDIEWTSSDANVCTVANGVITGVAQGNAKVNANATHNGVAYTAQIDVVVAVNQPMLSFDLKNDYVVKDESTELSVYLVKDGKATKVENSKVVYSVDCDKATISGNKLTGVAIGKVNLTATTTTENGEVTGTTQLDVLRYCTVSYVAEGSVVATEQVLNSKGATTSVVKPELDGYVFKEWKLNGESFAEGSIVNDDISVQASWYKLTNESSGKYVQKTIIKKVLDVNDFSNDGSYALLSGDSLEVQMQKTNVYDYFVTFPAFNFAGQKVTQFYFDVNYVGYQISFNGVNLAVTSTNSDPHPRYDFVVHVSADGSTKLTNGSVVVALTDAQANGTEGLTFNFVRPNSSPYATCIISPMFLCTFDYDQMITDDVNLLAEMTAESDKNEYFSYYTNYYDSFMYATPYECQNATVPSGVTHARSLFAGGSYTLIDFTNDKHGVSAQQDNGTLPHSISSGENNITIDPSSNEGLYTVCLPKVNYSLYKSVTFTYSVNAVYAGIGLDRNNMISDGGKGQLNGTVTINITDGAATAVLHDNLLNQDLTIELSQDVVNGDAQMQLFFEPAIYRQLTISNFTVTM